MFRITAAVWIQNKNNEATASKALRGLLGGLHPVPFPLRAMSCSGSDSTKAKNIAHSLMSRQVF